MATAVEEPDLFNGLEITEMDEINMENGDEYVFIPSDNENEDENGPGSHGSLATQSVFHPAVALPVVSTVEEIKTTEAVQGVPGVERMDTESDQLLASIDLGDALVGTAGEARVTDGEVIIVKRIDLTEEEEAVNEQDDQRFTVSYDFNLDMQQLLNIEQAEEIPAEVTIKEEIDIEEAVVNLPDDEETGLSVLLGSELDLVHHDEHIVGSEVITLDSDAAESENEEDCIMMSLLEQCPITIKEEGPDEDRSPVENDHAYTSQPLEDQTVPDATNEAKPDATLQQTLVDMSKRLLEEVDPSGTDLDETLKSIASLEEQLKSLKDKLLQNEKPPESAKEGTDDAPLPPPPLEEPTDAPPSRKESCEMDTLSVELSENCSERLECSSVTDLAVLGSDVGEKVSEPVGQEAAETNSASATDDTDEQLEKKSTEDLSKNLSQNASEPLEHDNEHATEAEDASDANEDANSMETEQEATANQQQAVEEDTTETVQKETEEIQQAEDEAPASVEGGTNQDGLKIKSLEDLIAYGEMFTKECECWLDKINNNNCRQSEQEDGKEPSQADKEQFAKAERFMASLTKDVQRLTLKISSKEKSHPDRVEVSVQTEKVPRTNAKALNEKYKKRLLSSLGETEEAEQGLSDSDGESYVSNDGDNRSSDAADADVYDDADDDEDEAAFERRQNRRKSKRLRQQLVNEKGASDHDESDEEEVQPSKKRNARRLGSTDSSIDKDESRGKSPTAAVLEDSEEICA